EPENLQAGDHAPTFTAGLVGRERGLAVAGTRHEMYPVRAGRREDRVLDERGDRVPALEPRGERGHGELDVLAHQLHEPVDVGEVPRPHVAFQQLLYPGVVDVGLRSARAGANRLTGP